MLAQLEIDLQAIRTNAETIARFVAPSRLAAVVKANGYGHGIVEVARALEGVAERLCVYDVSEAVALRDAGIATPILICGPIAARDLEAAHACNAEITLWDTGSYADAVAQTARKRGSAFRVHVKIESGIARLGLAPGETLAALARYEHTPGILIDGVYSHLAASEELDSDFTLVQLERFQSALVGWKGTGVRHIAASAAALLWPQTRLDMVRVGIALYGLWPSPETQRHVGDRIVLRPAMRWNTQIVAVREVEAGTTIGYGRTYRAPSRTRIGVLPIGYAEGLPRAASNRGAVLIGGRRCPIVGRVCMNMTMVDVGEVPSAVQGTPVTLIGSDGGERIGADDWGEWSSTINYEIVARLPREIPRSYLPRAAIASAKTIVPS